MHKTWRLVGHTNREKLTTSSSQFSSSGSKVSGEEEDDVDRSKDDKENKSTRGKKQVDDMEKQKDVEADVGAFFFFFFDPHVGAFNAANTSHDVFPSEDVPQQAQAGLEFDMAADALNAIGVKVQHSLVPKSADLTFPLQKETEDSNDHISNSSHGLLGVIELEVDLNPRNIRKSIRSQAYEECMSSNEVTYDDEEFRNATQEQQLDVVEQELQDTIIAANILGIEYVDTDVRRMRRMIETEAKGLQQLQRNNRFAPFQKI
ncbi:hypothetical protein RHMOL_Rhmol13G0164500 [Rhododendron molle]|uniref:Uncharacterized protein n=1 Tax=Rhododendron molle TaxID=49168 RepID=A0ACC0L8C4_RHOML|nr:hypothetical protein RHMOL_Rhmol13G0164500 [Rhododendron molle]